MNEDSWLEAAYEDRNGGDVDIMDSIYDEPIPECSREWDGECDGELINRVTAGGYPDVMCEHHLTQLQDSLAGIAERYPEMHHPEYCTCYGCSEGGY